MHSCLPRFMKLSPLLLLAACATLPPTQPLPGQARSEISSSEVVVPIRQSEIYVFVPDSQIAAAGGGGLLLALIDAGVNSVRTSKAETAVKPLRDAVVDFDFDAMMRDDLKDSLSHLDWLHVHDVHVVKDVTPKGFDNELVGSKDEAVLFTTMDYQLSNDASALTITLNAGLYANSDALRALRPGKASSPSALENAIYRNTFRFDAPAPSPTIDRDQNIAEWSADHGAVLRAALKKGASDLAARLAGDLGGPASAGGSPAASR